MPKEKKSTIQKLLDELYIECPLHPPRDRLQLPICEVCNNTNRVLSKEGRLLRAFLEAEAHKVIDIYAKRQRIHENRLFKLTNDFRALLRRKPRWFPGRRPEDY